MQIRTHVLVLAARSVAAPTLLGTLERRAAERPGTRFTLIVPAADGLRAEAQAGLDGALAILHVAGVDAAGQIGDVDPVSAVLEVYSPTIHDEIIVSTFTAGASQWLATGLPSRIQRLTGAVVHHVAVPPREGAVAAPATSPSLPVAKAPLLERVVRLLRVETNRSGHPYG